MMNKCIRVCIQSMLVTCAALCIIPAYAQSQQTTPTEQGPASLTEVVVTAQKRKQSILQVPVSITAISPNVLKSFNAQRFIDYAGMVPNLDYSFGGTGGIGLEQSRAIEMRGMSGAGTTAMYIDDTPVPSTLDPSVADIARIEVLRGPQGSLFGQESLGGAIRFISNAPSLGDDSLKYDVQTGWTERAVDPNYGATVVGNWDVIPGTLGVRIAGTGSSDAGFVKKTYPCAPGAAISCTSNGQGANDIYGGSLAVLWQVTERFGVDGKVLAQSNYYPSGFPAVLTQPKNYSVNTFAINREFNAHESEHNNWSLPALTLRYDGNGWAATSATSYYSEKETLHEDDTEGAVAVLQQLFGFTPALAPLVIPAEDTNYQLYEEVRVTFQPIYSVSGIFGGYYNRGSGNGNTYVDAPGLGQAIGQSTNLLYDYTYHDTNREKALFGQLYYKFLRKWTLTAGARSYWLGSTGLVIGTGTFGGPPTLTSAEQHGVSPKFALQYDLSPNSMLYTSAAKGYRPGGGQNPVPSNCAVELAQLGLTFADTTQFKSDDVWSYELGGKTSMAGGKMLLTGAAFDIEWKNIQQPINLASCGAQFIGNAGAARNQGLEIELSSAVSSGLTVSAALGFVKSVITQAAPGDPQKPGDRVFNVPRETAHLAAVYTVSLPGGRNWILASDASYLGDSISNNTSAATPITRPAYLVWNARTALQWSGNQELSLFAKNLTNERANLGDLQPLAFGQNATIDGVTYPIGRIRILAPFTFGVEYRHGF